MGSNNFTKTFSDGTALTEAELTTMAQSLTLDLSNTTQMTTSSTSGNFLKSNGDGAAASWGLPLDPLGPFAVRNYGLSTSVSSGALTVALKTNAAATPSSTDPIDVPFSNNGTTTATYTALQVTGALSFTITASATLGFTGTSTNRVFVYALNNSGTIKLGVSARSDLDTAATVTPVVMSNAADSAAVLYATATTAVVPRLLGWIDSALNSSSQWQTPSHCGVINQYPGRATVSLSTSSGNFTSNATAVTPVTNLSVSFTSTGRPVQLQLVPDGTTNLSFIGSDINSSLLSKATYYWKRGSTEIGRSMSAISATKNSSNALSLFIPPTSLTMIDVAPAGTYTYTLSVNSADGELVYVQYCKLLINEL